MNILSFQSLFFNHAAPGLLDTSINPPFLHPRYTQSPEAGCRQENGAAAGSRWRGDDSHSAIRGYTGGLYAVRVRTTANTIQQGVGDAAHQVPAPWQ